MALKTLLICALLLQIAVFISANEVETQEPHYKNGEHNPHSHEHGGEHGSTGGCPYHKKKEHDCPAIHNGECPYTKDGGKEIKKELKNCPDFKEGCPYHGDKEAMEKVGGCPKFKDGGCPFQAGKVDESLNDCPAFSKGCPYHHHAETRVSEEDTKGCPVLQDQNGCPYLKEGTKELAEEFHHCPQFKKGCPYSNDKETLQKTHDCPAFKEGCPFTHEQKDVEVNKWKDCPAFHGGCPYTHSHAKLLKETALKILTGENLDEILAPNFVAVLKSTPHANEDIDKAKFQEFSANFHAKMKWNVTPLLTVAEGNIVVVHARYDGMKEGHEIKDFETMLICTFNEDAKVEKLFGLSDLGTYAQNMGVPLKVD